jgi:hypothetical protein
VPKLCTRKYYDIVETSTQVQSLINCGRDIYKPERCENLWQISIKAGVLQDYFEQAKNSILLDHAWGDQFFIKFLSRGGVRVDIPADTIWMYYYRESSDSLCTSGHHGTRCYHAAHVGTKISDSMGNDHRDYIIAQHAASVVMKAASLFSSLTSNMLEYMHDYAKIYVIDTCNEDLLSRGLQPSIDVEQFIQEYVVNHWAVYQEHAYYGTLIKSPIQKGTVAVRMH